MNTPTQNQIRELWKWCGFKEGTCGWMYHPDKPGNPVFPALDLNNLFKYAVPKVALINEIQIVIPPGRDSRFRVSVGHSKVYEDSDPAIALFWAIYQIIEGEVK